MAFILPKPSEGNGDFERAPEGTHVARCISIVDMGMQTSTFSGEEKSAHKVHVAFELSHERDAKGRPFIVSKRYTVSLHEKASLRKDLEAWRGKSFSKDELAAFDLAKLCGVACMVTVKHTTSADGSKTYANIVAISGLPKGMEQPPNSESDPLVFTLSDPWNRDAVPEWLATKINWSGAAQAKPSAPAAQPQQVRRVPRQPEPVAMAEDFNDEIPF